MATRKIAFMKKLRADYILPKGMLATLLLKIFVTVYEQYANFNIRYTEIYFYLFFVMDVTLFLHSNGKVYIQKFYNILEQFSRTPEPKRGKRKESPKPSIHILIQGKCSLTVCNCTCS